MEYLVIEGSLEASFNLVDYVKNMGFENVSGFRLDKLDDARIAYFRDKSKVVEDLKMYLGTRKSQVSLILGAMPYETLKAIIEQFGDFIRNGSMQTKSVERCNLVITGTPNTKEYLDCFGIGKVWSYYYIPESAMKSGLHFRKRAKMKKVLNGDFVFKGVD